MTKKRTLLVVLLAVVMTVACFMFAACGAEKHAIKWEYDSSLVTVSVEGYDTLPEELEEDKEIVIKVTPKAGYSVTVSGTSQDGDNYKLKMGKRDITVKITATKILNDITVKYTGHGHYFDGETVDKADLEVVANYELGDETVTAYTITYANGNAFTTGDTSFKVTFSGKSKDITVSEVTDQQNFRTITLKVNEDGNPVLVATGTYNAEGDKAAAKAKIEDYFNCVKENGTWATKDYEANATVEDNNDFVLEITLKEWSVGKQYYVQYKEAADGSDLSIPGGVDEETVITLEDGTTFYLTDGYSDWGSHPVFLWIDAAYKFEDITLVAGDNGAPLVKFTGSYATNVFTTAEAAKTAIENAFYFDLMDFGWNTLYKSEETVSEEEVDTQALDSTVTVVIGEDGAFTVLCDISAINAENTFFGHLGDKDTNMKITFTEASVNYGGLTYKIAAADASVASWASALPILYVTAAE